MKGFASFPERVADDKVRGKPEKFADHYTQARLFYESQTPTEQAHIAGGFRFELSKLTVPAIRERMLSSLVNASPLLAQQVADGLGMVLPDSDAEGARDRRHAGDRAVAVAVADGIARRRQHPHAERSPS